VCVSVSGRHYGHLYTWNVNNGHFLLLLMMNYIWRVCIKIYFALCLFTWWPVLKRIKFPLCVPAYTAISTVYGAIVSCRQHASNGQGRRQLRTSALTTLIYCFTHSAQRPIIGHRAFPVADSRIPNSLPALSRLCLHWPKLNTFLYTYKSSLSDHEIDLVFCK